ncbi:MAG: carboxylating nicotinate-nucleotide diphosphorylase [Chloroflexi bacterium]|nr:carboxylating nicotinate-nucleotide diphosphorylase [Chloroflexota bacterium]
MTRQHPERRRSGRSTVHTVTSGHETLLDPKILRRLAESALLEDHAWQDVTTDPLIPDEQQGQAQIIAKADGVIAGLPMAETVFAAADATLAWQPHLLDKQHVSEGDTIATIEGSIASILRAERVALNFVGHLSGIATATAAVVYAIHGTRCHVRDTRKTLPGLRSLEKYAVRMGGGMSHRADLAAAVLIKDNHIAALYDRDLDIATAVKLALNANPLLKVEVEVTSLDEAQQAANAGAHELLLDNMSIEAMREVVQTFAVREHPPALEASGGITLLNARAVAETGVDYISMGALTHSAAALDISLKLTDPRRTDPGRVRFRSS